jgi:hypothetical protein
MAKDSYHSYLRSDLGQDDLKGHLPPRQTKIRPIVLIDDQARLPKAAFDPAFVW